VFHFIIAKRTEKRAYHGEFPDFEFFQANNSESEFTMQPSLDLKPILHFLDELGQNNNKVWFDAHRPAYESTRKTFEQFINDLIDEFRAPDHLQDLTARECSARIYRDIRFSKDKSPYKKNYGAIVAPGGWRTDAFGYYVSIQPGGQSMVAGGLYSPTAEQLYRFRQMIAKDAAPFKKITQAKEFVTTFGAVAGDRLKTAPKGFDREHPEISLLRLKQITALHPFTDAEVLANDFEEKVIEVCQAMRPFLDYLAGIFH
jgi:uncharacterized protein (TIGR02453 family)